MTPEEKRIVEHALAAGFRAGWFAAWQSMIEETKQVAAIARSQGDQEVIDGTAAVLEDFLERQRCVPRVETVEIQPGDDPAAALRSAIDARLSPGTCCPFCGVYQLRPRDAGPDWKPTHGQQCPLRSGREVQA